jgi:LPS-assembly protein
MCRRQRTFALGSLATLALLILASLPSLAQDPSLYIGNGPPRQQSSFAKQPGGMFGPAPKIDQAQPLYLQADQLLYDTKSSRVIAQGNVEIYYNNFVLTADQVVYDQSTNKLIAEGQRPAQGSERQHHQGRPLRGP